MRIPLQQALCCYHHCIPGNTPFMLPSTFAMLHTWLQQHIMDHLSLSKLCSHFEAYLLPPALSTSWYLKHFQEMDDPFPPACLDWELVLLPLQYISKFPGLYQATQLIGNLWHYCSDTPEDTGSEAALGPVWDVYSQMLDTHIWSPLFFPNKSLDSKAQGEE